jgi:hypothetical protein
VYISRQGDQSAARSPRPPRQWASLDVIVSCKACLMVMGLCFALVTFFRFPLFLVSLVVLSSNVYFFWYILCAKCRLQNNDNVYFVSYYPPSTRKVNLKSQLQTLHSYLRTLFTFGRKWGIRDKAEVLSNTPNTSMEK